MNVTDAINLIFDEWKKAGQKHPAIHSAHEGYAVILEELDELWQEIKNNPCDEERVRAEAVQVAAMALRFIVDLALPVTGRKVL